MNTAILGTSSPSGKPARIRLGVRQVRRDLPNLRDHGLMVDRPLLNLLASLQRKHGYGWASEGSLRAMIYQDTGHLPGVGTIPKALRRLERIGYCEARWITRGGRTPDGGTAERGMLRLRLAVHRGERRAIASRSRTLDRRQGVDGRIVRAVPADYAAAMREISRGSATRAEQTARERDRSFEQTKADSTRRALELAALWGEDPPKG